MTLREAPIGRSARVVAVDVDKGGRAFRRRLLELGLVPGTEVQVLRVAPLGDPIELLARGCLLSIRKADAASVHVELAP
ncbi:MAG: ferrous iron transport protein A [Myxococcales bacterium]|nr:ferrous iron transport protein A [Myxococcales bacterium]